MKLLKMTANYELRKQNSYYVTKYFLEELVRVLRISNRHKNKPFSNIILSQFVV